MSELRTDKILNTTSGTSVKVDRTSSNGDIVELQKDGSTVGSIGVVGGDIPYFATSDGNDCGINLDGDSQRINPANGSGGAIDNQIDLGQGGARFKDLYLGGNIYLGGTGSANALDDYEEGVHEVTITGSSGGSATVGDSARKLKYIKIGNEVWVHGEIHITGISSISGTVRVSLPFAVQNIDDLSERSVGSCALRNIDISSGVVQVTPFCYGGQSFFTFRESYDNSSWGDIAGSALSSGDEFVVSLQYTTA